MAYYKRNHFVPNKDEFKDLETLRKTLKDEGIKSSNLIIGIDFSERNRNKVKHFSWRHNSHTKSANNAHNVKDPSPYEHAIRSIEKAFIGFDDEDNKIPCFGFGDETTNDQKVFSFYRDGAPCNGFKDVLDRYQTLLQRVRSSESTCFAPIIHAAIDVVKGSGRRYHILVIIANGQVNDKNRANKAIVYASSFPLSIIVVGVGEGPWDTMKQFDDALQKRKFDNLQFVNYTEIVNKYENQQDIEYTFTLKALMELPQQFKAIKQFACPEREKNAIIIPPP